MRAWLKQLFFLLIVDPIIFIVLGLNIRHRELLPKNGPAIIVANHNSHLDTVVLMSLFPHFLLPKLRPVAAADYFLSSRLWSFIALKLIGIIPITRNRKFGGSDPLQAAVESLEAGEILILFPEGTRGEPEIMANFKSGVAHLAKRFPQIPVIPIFLHGLGKALPKGEGILVPFFCDVFVGEPLFWSGDKAEFITSLEAKVKSLPGRNLTANWDDEES